jgi:gliding motility-associated-like protein
MTLSPGTNYTISSRTVTPATGFTGTLSVPVVVNDGTDNSNTFSLQITVTPKPVVNTPPTITGQASLSTQEDQPITVGLQHLTVNDPDNAYPTGFTMTLTSGPNYSINDKTITPSPGFTGTLSVPTIVNDGEANSNTFALQITVTAKPVTNVRPTIAGQVPLTMLNNQSLTIAFSNLIVTDPDDTYPTGFTLKVLPGDNYSVSGVAVTPTAGFVGILSVNVVVNDGELDSNPFQLRITVSPANTNVKPVITGQLEVTTFTNTPITLNLSHLLVTDPDDAYPTGFTLAVQPGSNYTVSGTTITPATNFIGPLTAGVTVNDGTTSSEVFNFRISVIDRGQLQIVGQSPISTTEDSPVTLDLTKLQVNDPDKQYPTGFSIQAQAGDNYSLNGNQVVPKENFFGNLTVPVAVTNGQRTSDSFSLIITVTPVNDPPVFSNFNEGPIPYFTGNPIPIAREISIDDPDNESLVFAEARIDGENFLSGKEELIAQPVGNIQSVFDPNTGILILIGQGSIAEYEAVLQSIQYHFKTDTLPSVTSRLIRFKLNDGQVDSEIKTKTVNLEESVSLDIPNVFTPNGDDANDTWKISNGQPDNITATVRVFDKKGLIIYESDNLAPWDGRYRGEIVSPDTYFYVIEVNAGLRTISKRGVVTVVR